MEGMYKQWAHGPSHLFVPRAAYFVTGGTYKRVRYFTTPERLSLVLSELFMRAEEFGWQLQAWVILQNHYHFVAHAPEDAGTLKRMIQAIHSTTARAVNREDGTPGRRVWFQYRDTCLTSEKSYLARLHYVHVNPVKHGVSPTAENYRWCSMSWFVREADPGFRRTVLSFPIDRLEVWDDF